MRTHTVGGLKAIFGGSGFPSEHCVSRVVRLSRPIIYAYRRLLSVYWPWNDAVRCVWSCRRRQRR